MLVKPSSIKHKEAGLYYMEVDPNTLSAVDFIVKYAEGKTSESEDVVTDGDWDVLVTAAKVWSKLYPVEFKDFAKSCDILKAEYRHTKGKTKEEKGTGGVMMMHRLDIPQSLDLFWRVFFPRLTYTSKFINRLVKELPVFNIAS